MVYFINRNKNEVTLPHISQNKHAFLVKTKEKDMSKKLAPKKKVTVEFLHHRLGHKSTRSLIAGDTFNSWQDIEIRIDTYPFCTSCQISSKNKKAISKTPLKPEARFK